MMILIEALVSCSLLAIISWKMDVLTAPASVAAFVIGSLIWIVNGPFWVLLLACFMFIGYIGTKWKIDVKKKISVEESTTGKRSLENILANGASPAMFAILLSPLGFVGSISTALSDTLASEIGVLSDKARLITTWKKADPGTNGAVSPLGTFASALGAGTMAILSYFILGLSPLPTFFGGFLGCQVDSLLGATLERRGFINKSVVNLIATFSGGIIALILSML